MKGILRVAQAHLLTALREKITLFWFLIFPLFLLAILTLIFGNMGTEGEISFAIAVVNLETDTAGPVDFAGIIEGVFEQAGKPSEEGKEPLFVISSPASGEALEDFSRTMMQEFLKVPFRSIIENAPPRPSHKGKKD